MRGGSGKLIYSTPSDEVAVGDWSFGDICIPSPETAEEPRALPRTGEIILSCR